MDIFEYVKTETKALLQRQGLEIRNCRSQRSKERLAQQKAAEFVQIKAEINLELGAGPVKGKNGWVTIDQCEEADISCRCRFLTKACQKSIHLTSLSIFVIAT
jgi:hypothetical protein